MDGPRFWHRCAKVAHGAVSHPKGGAVQTQCTTIGLDVAKNIFQVHGVDSARGPIIRQRLRRAEVLSFFEGRAPCLVGLEACASAYHWGREIEKLGHEVRLMLPQYASNDTSIPAKYRMVVPPRCLEPTRSDPVPTSP
jgi:hypothetical protein